MNPPESLLRVGVLGGNGYTGRELLSLLRMHTGVRVVFATSRGSAGAPSGIPGLPFTPPDQAPLEEVDLVFLCLPHGEAAAWASAAPSGLAIIDLTADHRPGSGREAGWTFGLAERRGSDTLTAQRIANPGCYPTGVLLSLLPLRESGVIDEGRLTVVNAASGVTGAGRTPRADLLFAEVAESYKVYGEGNRHRHLREMRALLPGLPLFFQPHLLPVRRGILETIVLPVHPNVDPERVRARWREAYASHAAVEVFEEGLPELSRVVGTDRLSLGVCEVHDVPEPVVTIVAAFDNLGKGAAGQAVQNMNLMRGWPLDRGIRC